MASPFELICHHTYKGLPVDLSDYDSHGQAFDIDFLADGAVAGSGAVRFTVPQSRILVASSPASKSLGGMKVEVTLRRTQMLNNVSTLVGGHNSFNLFLLGSQLCARFKGNRSPLLPHEGLPTDSGGIETPPGSVLLGNNWTTLAFVHNGIDTIELYADGQLLAQRTDILASVGKVGPRGISIGNGLNSGEFFRGEPCFLGGEIDEVKIWRLDPSIMDRQFFDRPKDPEITECWNRFFHSLAKALQQNPECARKIDGTLVAMIDGIRRNIMAYGPETRKRYIKTCEQYLQLWRAGKLDSPEMAKLSADWCAWLRLVGFSFKDDPAVKELLGSDCLRTILAECEPLECDPQFSALVCLIIKELPPMCDLSDLEGEQYGR
jgi:Concanavalin A-like lectin/glucanases superfamily